LQKTSLIAMINASKIVTDRLDFLKGLEYLLYDPEMRATVKERSQLHKLVSRNTWVFGEEFFLVNDDESLENVLRKHVKGVLFDADLDPPVIRPEGTTGVVDIGLSSIPQDEEIVESDVMISKILGRGTTSEARQHLVIELKRPSQPVNAAVIAQAESYGFAVAADDRFQNVRTNWSFWAVSTRMDKYATLKAQQEGLPRGVVYQSKADAERNYNLTIWAKSWSEIIEQCSSRLRFFQERLNYNANQSSGKQFLRDTYPKFIPNFVKDQNATPEDEDDEVTPPTPSLGPDASAIPANGRGKRARATRRKK
jgi:hypothetical protein